MRHLLLSLLLVTAFGIAVQAQSGKLDDPGDNCLSNNPAIVTPPAHIDFKIIVIVPPKDFDRAMVVNPCPTENRIACGARVPAPQRSPKPGLKLSPKGRKKFSA